MNANAKPDTAPLHDYVAQVRALARDGKYVELAETYNSFIAAHPNMSYHAIEPLQFLIGNHLVEKTGKSSAFSTMTLRNRTWAEDLLGKIGNPAEFASSVKGVEDAIHAIGK